MSLHLHVVTVEFMNAITGLPDSRAFFATSAVYAAELADSLRQSGVLSHVTGINPDIVEMKQALIYKVIYAPVGVIP